MIGPGRQRDYTKVIIVQGQREKSVIMMKQAEI